MIAKWYCALQARLRPSADGFRRGDAGMAELADAMDSRPIVARHESSILSPGTSMR